MASRPDWLSVDADETVVWQGAPRVRRILPTAAAATLWIALLVLAVTVGPRVAPVPARAFPGVVLAGAALLLAGPAVAAVAWAYLRTTNVEYVLTDRNCYRKSGVLSTRVSRIGLSTVERTSLSKDVWGNLFDYGTVAVSTAGSGGAEVTFTDLNDPETFRDELRRVTRRYRSEDAETSAVTGALDAGTAAALLDDARAMHETADRLAAAVIDG